MTIRPICFALILICSCTQEPKEFIKVNNLDFNEPPVRPRAQVQSKMAVVGYLPNWDLDKVAPESMGHLTQVIFFAMEMNAEGRLFTQPITPQILYFVHRAKRDYGVEIYLCMADLRLGKERKKGMAGIVFDDQAQDKLFGEIVKTLKEGAWDGLDIDWEYPQTDEEKKGYARFLGRLGPVLKSQGFGLTIASSPWHVLPPDTYKYLDGVNMMVYDNDARTAAYDLALKKTKDSITKDGVPRRLYRLGLPFYGTGDRIRKPLSVTPWTIRGLKQRYNLYPETSAAGGYAFDSETELVRKVKMARDLGLGGLMIWAVNQDTNGPESYLKAITRTLNLK